MITKHFQMQSKTVVFSSRRPSACDIITETLTTHADMKFPFLCLLCVMMKFTHSPLADVREADGGRHCRINTAARVLCYKLCYLLSLLWEADLRC